MPNARVVCVCVCVRACMRAHDPRRLCCAAGATDAASTLLRRIHDNEPPSINHREDRFRVGRGGERPPRAEFSALLMATDLGLPSPPPAPLGSSYPPPPRGRRYRGFEQKYRRVDESLPLLFVCFKIDFILF